MLSRDLILNPRVNHKRQNTTLRPPASSPEPILFGLELFD